MAVIQCALEQRDTTSECATRRPPLSARAYSASAGWLEARRITSRLQANSFQPAITRCGACSNSNAIASGSENPGRAEQGFSGPVCGLFPVNRHLQPRLTALRLPGSRAPRNGAATSTAPSRAATRPSCRTSCTSRRGDDGGGHAGVRVRGAGGRHEQFPGTPILDSRLLRGDRAELREAPHRHRRHRGFACGADHRRQVPSRPYSERTVS
jgi:hypothetical protein